MSQREPSEGFTTSRKIPQRWELTVCLKASLHGRSLHRHASYCSLPHHAGIWGPQPVPPGADRRVQEGSMSLRSSCQGPSYRRSPSPKVKLTILVMVSDICKKSRERQSTGTSFPSAPACLLPCHNHVTEKRSNLSEPFYRPPQVEDSIEDVSLNQSLIEAWPFPDTFRSFSSRSTDSNSIRCCGVNLAIMRLRQISTFLLAC